MSTGLKIAGSTIVFALVVCVAIFLPAGTFNYWQAWLMLGIYAVCTAASITYLQTTDPAAVRRRERGLRAEESPGQRRLVVLATSCFFAVFVVSGLDHRFGWSHAPAVIAWIGNILFVASFALFLIVMRTNAFAATNITVEPEQRVATSGPYALVRHPMYSGVLLLFIAIPLALGSYWGVLLLLPATAILTARLRDEEHFLIENLPGYADYRAQTRWRLIPRVF